MTDEVDSMGRKTLEFWQRKRTDCKVKGGVRSS